MKPIKLTIEGIRSFSDRAEIDFATVGKSGLFGIFGNTGSGKSTILDGIILALYGKLTGLEMQELVSTRSEKAYAALEFEISSEEGRKRYFVERYFTLKKDRSYGSARAEIYEVKGGEYFILAAQTGMVNEKVEEILGLGLNEFTKCIVLPQGEFAEFVSSTKSERVRIVEKLFDLGRFGERFNLKLKAKREECQNKINILEAQREPYKSATEEEIEKVEKEIEECNKDIKIANGIIAKIERKISENEKFYEIEKESEEVKKQIEKATQELNETDKIKVLVLKYDLAKKISDLSAEATKAEEEEQICEKVFKAAEEEYEKRLIEKQKAESELKKCEEEGEEISGLEKTVAELGALEGDYIRVQTLKSELSALSLKLLEEERVRERKMAEIEENQAEIDRLNSQITELSEDCDPAKAFDGVRNQALKEEFIKQSDYYAKRKEKIRSFADGSPLYEEVSGEYSARHSEYGERLNALSLGVGEDIASSVVRFGEANEKREKAL
ncbi:MAG: SMC family ATPase, partial [Clostridia bacterium]|nr:SMC family ATPase [Clostridia bacterium]